MGEAQGLNEKLVPLSLRRRFPKPKELLDMLTPDMLRVRPLFPCHGKPCPLACSPAQAHPLHTPACTAAGMCMTLRHFLSV